MARTLVGIGHASILGGVKSDLKPPPSVKWPTLNLQGED